MNFATPSISLPQTEKSAFIAKTYGWMALALLVSAAVSFLTAASIFSGGKLTPFGSFLFGGRGIGFWVFAIAEIALVWWLSASIRKISVRAAAVAFFAYSVINGITLSSIFIVYQIGSVASCFFGASAMFAAMSVYGAKTRRDLTTVGKYLTMALLGIVVANLVQLLVCAFTGRTITFLDFILSVAGVVVFTGLTAYDTQKLVNVAENANGGDDYRKISIVAALELYLDFINLFLSILRLFGKRR